MLELVYWKWKGTQKMSEQKKFVSQPNERESMSFWWQFQGISPLAFPTTGVKGEFNVRPLPPLSWHRIMKMVFTIYKKEKKHERRMHFFDAEENDFIWLLDENFPLRHPAVEGWSNSITIPTSNQHRPSLCLTAIVCICSIHTLLAMIKPYNTLQPQYYGQQKSDVAIVLV